MGNNSFAPYYKQNGSFIVKNISSIRKTIKIFNYPINFGYTRDLLQIPGVAENDIRASLLKGEINHKIRANEIVIISSDIDLLQFNADQRSFLQNSGIVDGLQTNSFTSSVIRKEDIILIGNINSINTNYTIPSGKFIENSIYKIIVYLNGVKQVYLDDYFIAESGGPGTGYDTIIMSVAPTAIPAPSDIITADYYVNNT